MLIETLHGFFNSPLTWLITFLSTPEFALWGPFLALLGCGIGLPIPEDVILVTAGFLAGRNGSPILPPIIITYFGIILGDSFIFFVGARLGRKVLKSAFGQKILTPSRLHRAKSAFHKYGIWVNFFGRFFPGVRTAIFFTGGSLHFPFLRFIMMDALAALISAPAFVWLGHWAGIKFAENIGLLEFYIRKTKTFLSIGVLCLLFFVLAIIILRSKKKSSTA